LGTTGLLEIVGGVKFGLESVGALMEDEGVGALHVLVVFIFAVLSLGVFPFPEIGGGGMLMVRALIARIASDTSVEYLSWR